MNIKCMSIDEIVKEQENVARMKLLLDMATELESGMLIMQIDVNAAQNPISEMYWVYGQVVYLDNDSEEIELISSAEADARLDKTDRYAKIEKGVDEEQDEIFATCIDGVREELYLRFLLLEKELAARYELGNKAWL